MQSLHICISINTQECFPPKLYATLLGFPHGQKECRVDAAAQADDAFASTLARRWREMDKHLGLTHWKHVGVYMQMYIYIDIYEYVQKIYYIDVMCSK